MVTDVTERELNALHRNEWLLMGACLASVALFFLIGLFAAA